MAGKAINQHNAFTGLASAVNILVQEINQSDPNTFEHKKANLADMIKSVASVDDVVVGYYYNGTFYEESAHTTAMPAVTGRIYIDLGGSGELYRYTGTAYTAVTDNALRSALTGGTVTVDKATKDASGNTITTTYATKAEASAITDELQDTERVVESNSNRIANLEDKSQPFTIDYPSEDYGKGSVPANIADNANTVDVEGETGVTNQLVATNKIHQTITGNNGTYVRNEFGNFDLVKGHAYLVAMLGNAPKVNGLIMTNDYSKRSEPASSASTVIINLTSDSGLYSIWTVETLDIQYEFDLILRDLTPIFPKLTSAQITALGVAGVLKARPDLGKWNDYDAGSSITPMVTGMEHTGVNKWDEEWEVGEINYSTGAKENAGNTHIRSKNYIQVVPDTFYACNNSSSAIRLWFYDVNKNFISYSDVIDYWVDGKIKTPVNCCYVLFMLGSVYGTTYNHDIQFCLYSLPADIRKTHHAYKHSEITFSEPVPMNGVGDARDKLVPSTGKIERKCGTVDLSTLSWTFDSGYAFWEAPFTLAKLPANNDTPAVLGHAVYETRKSSGFSATGTNGICLSLTTPSVLRVKTTSNSVQPSGELIYELATPTTDTISPSPTALEVEPYGEIKVKQSQSIPLSLPFSMTYIPDSPYLMKKDVVDSLTSSATDLPLSANQGRIIKQTLDQHNARLTNLEEKAGDYVEVNYRGTDAVPTGKCKNALVNTIVHKTRAWNQLLNKSNYGATKTENNVTFTNNGDGSITVQTTSAGASANTVFRLATTNGDSFQMLAGHKYLIAGCPSGGSDSTFMLYENYYGHKDTGSGTVFVENTSRGLVVLVRVISGAVITTPITFKPIVRDLTPILSDWADADITTANIPLMVQQIPDLLKRDAFSDGKTISTEVEGVRAEGVNIYDQEWELGLLNWVTGLPVDSNSFIRSKNYIPAEQLKLYYGLAPTIGLVAYAFDKDYNPLGRITSQVGSGAFSSATPVGTAYIRWRCYEENVTTYNGEIQICDNALDNAIKTTFHDYRSPSTLTISPAPTGHSAGSVADTDELNVEVNGVAKRRKTVKIGEYTITGSESFSPTGGNQYIIIGWGQAQGAKLVAGSAVANILFAYAVTDSYSNANIAGVVGKIALDDRGYLLVTSDLHSNWSNYVGKKIYYELATYTETLSDPIIDNLIATEGGGTIRTKQTQGTEIDNSLDVGYLALGA